MSAACDFKTTNLKETEGGWGSSQGTQCLPRGGCLCPGWRICSYSWLPTTQCHPVLLPPGAAASQCRHIARQSCFMAVLLVCRHSSLALWNTFSVYFLSKEDGCFAGP